MRLLCLACLTWMVSACSSAPVREPDYTTPEGTLLSFHHAFKNEITEREYECFSQEFKRRHGNMDFSSYFDLRHLIEKKYPMSTWFFSLQDLKANITDRIVLLDEGFAWLKLSIMGEEITIEFVRETVYRLEFDEKGLVEDYIYSTEPFIHSRDNKLEVHLPLASKTAKNYPYWRKILVEKRWKFLDFSFLHERMKGSIQ